MVMKQRLRLAVIGFCGLLVISCGSAVDKDLDDARKALNDGNWSKAISSATAATTAEPTNLEAFLLLCAGYSGQAGVNLLELTKQLTDTTNSSTAFDFVHDTLFTTMTSQGCAVGTCLSDLNNAITTLTGFTGTLASSPTYLQEQYYFQLGILQYIQALGLPTLSAQPSASGTVTVSDVTPTITTTTQADLITGYTNITNSTTGITSTNALANTMAQNYWVLRNAAVGVGVASGFSQGVLQDLVLCQLSGASSTTTTVANCAVFNFSTACDVTAPVATGAACTND